MSQVARLVVNLIRLSGRVLLYAALDAACAWAATVLMTGLVAWLAGAADTRAVAMAWGLWVAVALGVLSVMVRVIVLWQRFSAYYAEARVAAILKGDP